MFNILPNTLDEFYTSVLTAAISSLKLNTYFDNFDAGRFNYDGIDHSLEFDIHGRVYNFDWFFKNHTGLYSAYRLLSDDSSKNLYLYLITYRLAGHHSVKLPLAFIGKEAEYEQYKAIETGTESKLPVTGMFGKLTHFDFEYEGHRYIADCLGFEYYLFRRQYFYSEGGVNVAVESGDNVIDGGACTGDSALIFSNVVGPAGKVYAFDPVAEHLEVLGFNINQFPYKNVVAMPYGLSDKNVYCDPLVTNHYSPGFRSANQDVPLRTIDSLVASKDIDQIDFIKLDVEGAELETLHGARQSIGVFKPKMAISLYHKPNDLYELIQYIHDAYPFYKLYLGHYTVHQEETVLYCLPS